MYRNLNSQAKSGLKLIRISRSVGDKLVAFAVEQNKSLGVATFNAGKFVDLAILEKMARAKEIK